jgi:hypothetical protein
VLTPPPPSSPLSLLLPPPLLQVLHNVTRAFHVADDAYARERALKLTKAKTAANPPPSSSSSFSVPASKPTILTGLGLVLWFEDKDEVKVEATVTVQKQSDSERVWWA